MRSAGLIRVRNRNRVAEYEDTREPGLELRGSLWEPVGAALLLFLPAEPRVDARAASWATPTAASTLSPSPTQSPVLPPPGASSFPEQGGLWEGSPPASETLAPAGIQHEGEAQPHGT